MHLGVLGRKGTNHFKSQSASKAPKSKELQVSGTSGVRFRVGCE